MKRRADKLAKVFNSLEDVSCVPAKGAMYLFPNIHLPSKAIKEAADQSIAPDALYCMAMLNATGVVIQIIDS